MTVTARHGLAPTREVLPNGLTIVAKETRTTPAVTIHAGLHAGPCYDPPSLLGVAHFVSRTIDRGTATRSADDIAEELDSRGVALNITATRHAITLVLTCLTEDFETIVALLADIIMRPSFPAGEVETRRGEIVTMIRQEEDNPATVAADGLMRLLYGDEHPYGRRTRGTVESVAAIDRAALQAFHASRFVPAAMSLAVVGDVPPARAIGVASAAFGDRDARPLRALEWPPVPQSHQRRVRVIPMMNKAQADVTYGFTSILRSDPAYYAYWLMNNIIGQYAIGGRLGESIRERQGMAYYAFSSLDANVVAGPLMVRVGANPVNIPRVVASIDEELTAFAADGPADRELEESKQYLVGSMPRTLESNLGIANFLQNAEFFGLGLDHDVRLPELIRGVTRDEVVAAARRTLDPARASIVVAGPYDGTLA